MSQTLTVSSEIISALREAKNKIVNSTKNIQRIIFYFDSYPFNEPSLRVTIILPQNSTKAWTYENTNHIRKQTEQHIKNILDIPIYVRFRGNEEELPEGWEITS
jgi:hypothetical protein